MQIFKITEEGLQALNKKLIRNRLILMAITIAVAFVIGFYANSKDDQPNPFFWILFIPIIILVNGSSFYRERKRQKAMLESYTLRVADNLLVREQLNLPSIYLYFNDIKEIAYQKNGNLVIMGKDAGDIIYVPAQIENYDALKNRLNHIQPITTKSIVPAYRKYQTLLSLLGVAAMICVYTLNNKIIVAVSGILFTILMLWSLYEIRRSRNIDKRARQGAWWILVVVASVFYVMIVKMRI